MRRGGISNLLAWAGALAIVLLGLSAPAPREAAASTATANAAAAGTAFSFEPAAARPSWPELAPGTTFDRAWAPNPERIANRLDRPVLNNIPIPIPPPVPYRARPQDDSVSVFIPYGRGVPVPNALPGHSDELTLSFDDCGSADQIQAVVDSLAVVHRHGLFFITGQCRDHFPWLVDTLKAAGHQVCNHTYSHPDLRRLSVAAIRWEIGHGVLAGCPYFRPPFGAWDGPRGRIARIAAEFGLTPLLWDVDSRDWAGAPAGSIAALARARGGVILLHLHGAATPEAIRLIG
jgi:peptidoglycan/xylan/chitin deacetylase (PgdA/CDA1 family)